jgi:hypothetical protein
MGGKLPVYACTSLRMSGVIVGVYMVMSRVYDGCYMQLS